jgi:hypothetical protein
MSYAPKDGSGALFKNDKKGNEKAPDYRGDAMIGGTLHEIAGWIKQGTKGSYLSLSVKVKTDRPQQQQREAPKRDSYNKRDSFDDFRDDPPPF